MTAITIRTIGNPDLTSSLIASIASETRHRTVSGAIRRLKAVSASSAAMGQAIGKWGHVEIEIDGKIVDADREAGIWGTLREDDIPALARELA